MAKSNQQKPESSKDNTEDTEVDLVAKTVKACEQCSHWEVIRNRARIAELLSTAIRKLRERFKADDFKPSVADYLKLIEMEKELADGTEDIKEIRVTWVEPTASDSGK